MADMIAPNSTQSCPKFKMTDKPCCQLCWQAFPWILFSDAFWQKKKKINFKSSPPPELSSLEQRVLWINCKFRTEISVATPPCWSKAEGTVNSLDGKLFLHVEHCMIQSPTYEITVWVIFRVFCSISEQAKLPHPTHLLSGGSDLSLVILYQSTETTRLKTYSVFAWWTETIITSWV